MSAQALHRVGEAFQQQRRGVVAARDAQRGEGGTQARVDQPVQGEWEAVSLTVR